MPLEAVTEVFSYEENWDAENRKMELTGSEDPATFCRNPMITGRLAGHRRLKPGESRNVLGVCIGDGAGKSCPAGVECQLFGGSYVPPEQLSFSQNAGGEYTMSMAYLLAWQGPVLEEEDPYGDGYSPDGLRPACHVQEIQVLPEKDYEAVKRAVYLYGGVQSSLYTAMVSDRDDTHYYRKETGRTGIMAMRSQIMTL